MSSFGTDGWTSPNHKAFVAVTVHFEREGEPITLLLDIIEVSGSHTGIRLAAEFAKILDDFGIVDKVSRKKLLLGNTAIDIPLGIVYHL